MRLAPLGVSKVTHTQIMSQVKLLVHVGYQGLNSFIVVLKL